MVDAIGTMAPLEGRLEGPAGIRLHRRARHRRIAPLVRSSYTPIWATSWDGAVTTTSSPAAVFDQNQDTYPEHA